MGNKGSKGKANRNTQANRAEESGEPDGVTTGGAGGGGGGELSLTITLVKLDLATVAQASNAKGAMVEVQWNSSGYDVYWSGQRLGSVPSNYNDQLMYPESHRGSIKEVTRQPPLVVIRVTVSR